MKTLFLTLLAGLSALPLMAAEPMHKSLFPAPESRTAVGVTGDTIPAAKCVPAASDVRTAASDTVIVSVKDAHRVVVTKNDSAMSVRIKGSGPDSAYVFQYSTAINDKNVSYYIDECADRWDFVTPFKRNKNKDVSYQLEMGGLYFGMVTGLNAPESMNLDMTASYEIGADLLALNTLSKGKRHDLSIGFGIDWRNYRMTGRTRFVKQEDGSLGTGAYPEGADVKFSRLKVFSLTFPLRYAYGFCKDFSVNAAAILSLNTYGSLKTRYKLEGEKVREFSRNIHQHPVSVDFEVGVAWRSMGFYVKYSPVSVLKNDFGPDFKPLSTGIKIFL